MPTPITTRLERAADRGGTSVTFLNAAERVPLPWSQHHDEARAVAAALQSRGVAPGDHVAILGPTTRELVTTIRACWLAGAASMVLPLPMRMGSLEEFVSSTRARIRHGDAALLLIDDQLAPFYEAAPGDPPVVSLTAVQPDATRLSPEAHAMPAPDPERLVILQYTSGSTSEPKGVMIPDRVLGANLDAITTAAALQDDDVFVSWLPLYHDMGLVGFAATPMCFGSELVLAAPQDFLAHPGHWMEWISEFGGSVTAGPNFSWVLATRALKRMGGLDLSRLRVALNGAEPIDPDAVEAFVAEAERFGFRPGAVFCAFGMAEVAIGGTFPPPMRGLRCDTVDRVVLEEKRVAEPADPTLEGTRRLPLLGPPVPGLEIRIVDPATGEELDERQVGELLIRGTSVTPGYYKRPEATAELLRDGWLHTGDLGYVLDGELVLCGRIKDVIIVGGRNVFPEDIERAVGTIDGIRTGNVIAFGVDGYKGKESVVVVAEVKSTDVEALSRVVHERVIEAVGLPAREVMLVQAGTLPKTSSGKLQRALCKERYLAEELQLVAG
ncbi:MAG TPA: fatty acyl-AMP ligase [Acidimicrobiales bacterium]|nr:fatty acyl-AMP ligase [Acidimicrobiales bacterium]